MFVLFSVSLYCIMFVCNFLFVFCFLPLCLYCCIYTATFVFVLFFVLINVVRLSWILFIFT